jgi:hypothetical protein
MALHRATPGFSLPACEVLRTPCICFLQPIRPFAHVHPVGLA